MRKLWLLIPIILITFIFIESCKKDHSSESSTNFSIFLTDAPGDFDSVFIEILSVKYHITNSQDKQGWNQIDNFSSGIYNLLELTNGIDTLLGNSEITGGKISQIRLVLGDNNRLVIDPNSFPLKIPSGSTSGLKLNVHAELDDKFDYRIWLDFDVCQSIIETSKDSYLLKPVIRTFNEATSGGILGMVTPEDSRPYVFVVAGGDTIGVIADSTGKFCIRGVPEDTYDLNFQPLDPYNDKTINNVSVTNGNTTDVGTVNL